MSRSFLGTATVTAASVIAIAFAAPAAAEVGTTAPCTKQSRAVTSAKKAVTKAQRAKASTPAARKQRAKRVKLAKAKHARAKKALAACRAQATSAPAPLPEPTPPGPAPTLPMLSVVSAAIGVGDPWRVVLAAPAPAPGTHYRLMYLAASGSRLLSCGFLAIRPAAGPTGETQLPPGKPWCPGAGRITLHVADDGTPLAKPGNLVTSIDVLVNPS